MTYIAHCHFYVSVAHKVLQNWKGTPGKICRYVAERVTQVFQGRVAEAVFSERSPEGSGEVIPVERKAVGIRENFAVGAGPVSFFFCHEGGEGAVTDLVRCQLPCVGLFMAKTII